jgi:hypothetical protein
LECITNMPSSLEQGPSARSTQRHHALMVPGFRQAQNSGRSTGAMVPSGAFECSTGVQDTDVLTVSMCAPDGCAVQALEVAPRASGVAVGLQANGGARPEASKVVIALEVEQLRRSRSLQEQRLTAGDLQGIVRQIMVRDWHEACAFFTHARGLLMLASQLFLICTDSICLDLCRSNNKPRSVRSNTR